jgi:hypothetical protein
MNTTQLAVTYVLRTDAIGEWLSIVAIVVSASVAIATFKMASKTREMAQATENELDIGRRQAVASEKAVAAATRPWIVPGEDRGMDEEDPDLNSPAVRLGGWDVDFPVYVWVRLTNVGPGLALIDSSNSWVNGRGQLSAPDAIERYANVFTDTPVVPSGGEFTMMGKIRASSANWSNIDRQRFAYPPNPSGGYGTTGEFVTEVSYTDAASENEVTAKIHVLVDYAFRCRVFRVDYFRRDATESFVSTNVGLPG